MTELLHANNLPRLSWLEIDLTLVAHAAPRRAHPLVVLEAVFKGVFERAGLDARQIKQLWRCPGKTVHTLGWQAGEPLPITLQLFGLEARHIPAWEEQLHLRFALDGQQNFALAACSPWRIVRANEIDHAPSAITLDFLTPVPLPHVPGHPNTALDEAGFIRLCQTRLRKLFGQEGKLPPAPVIDTSAWRYWRTAHRSRSQNGHPMFLNGCIGPLHLRGDTLPAWHPWLNLFSAIGLGERLTFGQGRFLLDTAPPAQEITDPPAPLQLRRPFLLDSNKPGARLGLANANLVVRHDDEAEFKLPLMRIAHIEIHSPCQISTPLLSACAQEGIPLLIAPPGQTPLVVAGQQAEAQRNRKLAAHHTAWAMLDDTRRARLAAHLIDEKLAGYAWLVRQRYQAGDHHLMSQIARARQSLAHARCLAIVRGWEGWATRHYHRWLQQHVQALGDFAQRRQHGQTPDPVNSLLNYGYALLRHRLACGVRLAGLDPWLGVLHEANGRHEALVSDLIEPWRAHVDRLVLRWIRLKIIQATSFSAEDGHLQLHPQARARMVQDFTRMMEETPRNGGPRVSTRIRQMLASYARAAEQGQLANWQMPQAGTLEHDPMCEEAPITLPPPI
ncbi:MAG: hypothetical protein RI925_99 [Pseudomonadota bacterium]